MATLISVDEFRERFDIDNTIEDPRLEPHVGSASRRLRKWVGADIYAAAVAIAEPGQDQDTDAVNDLKNAEAHLAMSYAILGLNTPFSAKGIVATAMSDEAKEVRKYLTPDETAKVMTMYLEMARQMADEYLAAVDDGSITFVIPGDCETSMEAATRASC